MLLGTHHKAPERHLAGIAHRLAKQGIGPRRALVLWDQQIGTIEVDRVDLALLDEGLDVDRMALARGGSGEVLVTEQHPTAILHLITLGDLAVWHLAFLKRTHAPCLDQRAVRLMQLAEVHATIAHGAVEHHRHVHQTEAERARPQWTRHQPSPRVRRRAGVAPLGGRRAPPGERGALTEEREVPPEEPDVSPEGCGLALAGRRRLRPWPSSRLARKALNSSPSPVCFSLCGAWIFSPRAFCSITPSTAAR